MQVNEEMWKNFIDRLHLAQPLAKPDKNGESPEHQNFLGSVESYRKIFMDANISERDKWIGTWIVGATQWAVFDGNAENRRNCINTLNRVKPDWKKA